MKNKQICPHCTKELRKLNITSVPHEHYNKKYIGNISKNSPYALCFYCHSIVHNKNCWLWNLLFASISTVWLIITLAIYLYFNNTLSTNKLLFVIFFSVSFIMLIIFTIPIENYVIQKRNSTIQHFILYDNNYKPIIHKSTFSAYTSFYPSIPAKQRKKEFVKDNILQISANSESEYIILTKADFETGKCEATFPAMKKENGLALLEKYSEFELSNGEEVLGTLKVEKVFDA